MWNCALWERRRKKIRKIVHWQQLLKSSLWGPAAAAEFFPPRVLGRLILSLRNGATILLAPPIAPNIRENGKTTNDTTVICFGWSKPSSRFNNNYLLYIWYNQWRITCELSLTELVITCMNESKRELPISMYKEELEDCGVHHHNNIDEYMDA